MNLAQIDFQQLRIKHILYKSKVRAMLYGGTYDADFFSRLGPVSQWFATVGQERYTEEPEMEELAKLHRELNATADELFSLYKHGRIDEAHEGLQTVEKKSDRFLAILDRLEKKLAVA